MKLKKGIDIYALPDHSVVTKVLVYPKGEKQPYPLVPFGPPQMAMFRKNNEGNKSGRTAYFAVIETQLVIAPPPSFDGEMKVRYVPPEEEI